MVIKLGLNQFSRDIKSGEFKITSFALILASMAITIIAFLNIDINNSLEDKSGELIAADRIIISNYDIDDKFINLAKSHNLNIAKTITLTSMLVANENYSLSQVKAVSDKYPLKGALKIKDNIDEKEYETNNIPVKSTVWLDEKLLKLLNAKIGDKVTIGYKDFTISKIITYEPDKVASIFSLSPRSFINILDINETKLLIPGSRATYNLLITGNNNNIKKFENDFKKISEGNLKLQNTRDSRPTINLALDRSEIYLNLTVMINIIIAGCVVWISAKRYSFRNLNKVAVFKALGASNFQVVIIYLISMILLAVFSGVLGAASGYILKIAIALKISEFLKLDPFMFSLKPMLLGISTSIIILVGFSLGPILDIKNVPPLKIIRKDLIPLSAKSIILYFVAFLSLFTILLFQTNKLMLGFTLLALILLTCIFSVYIAKQLIVVLSWVTISRGTTFKLAIGNIKRNVAQNSIQITAFALTIGFALTLYSIRTGLIDAWQNSLPENSPNKFAINISPDKLDLFENALKDNHIESSILYPMIRGRVIKINNEEATAKRGINRDWNLTYGMDIMPNNKIIKGKWFNENDKGKKIVSIEKNIAERLNVKLGDEIVFQIGSKSISTKIVSIREVDWQSFKPNFFIIFPDGLIDDFPKTYINSFYVPKSNLNFIVELVRSFPEISIIDVDSIIEQTKVMFDVIAKTVDYLWLFTLLLVIGLLFAITISSLDQRKADSAIIRALGGSKKLLNNSFKVEFVLLGTVSGIISVVCAILADYLITSHIFNLEFNLKYQVLILGPLFSILIMVTFGLISLRKVTSMSVIKLFQEI